MLPSINVDSGINFSEFCVNHTDTVLESGLYNNSLTYITKIAKFAPTFCFSGFRLSDFLVIQVMILSLSLLVNDYNIIL